MSTQARRVNISVNGSRIQFATDANGVHTINSGMRINAKDITSADDELFNAALDGLESVLLAMYSEGVDMGAAPLVAAIETAFNAISENY
jgi:hypothetical protein